MMNSKLSSAIQKPRSTSLTEDNDKRCCLSQETQEMLCFLMEFLINTTESVTILALETKQNKTQHRVTTPGCIMHLFAHHSPGHRMELEKIQTN